MKKAFNRNLENLFSFACLAAGRSVQEVQVVSPVFQNLATGLPNENQNETLSLLKQNQPEQSPIDTPEPIIIQKRSYIKEDKALRMSFGDPISEKEEKAKVEPIQHKDSVTTGNNMRDSGSIGRQSMTESTKHVESMKNSIFTKKETLEDNRQQQEELNEKNTVGPANRYTDESDPDTKGNDSKENIQEELEPGTQQQTTQGHVNFQLERYQTATFGRNSYSPQVKCKEDKRTNKRSKPKIKRYINSKSEERRAQQINKSAERKIKAILTNFEPQSQGFWRWGYNYKIYPPYGVAPEKFLADGLSKKECLNNSTLSYHKRFWGIEKRMQEHKELSDFSRPDSHSPSPLNIRTPYRIPKSSSQPDQSPISEVYEGVGLKFMNSQNASFVVDSKGHPITGQDESGDLTPSQQVKTEPVGLPEIKSSHRRAGSSAVESEKYDSLSRRTLSHENRDDILHSPIVITNTLKVKTRQGYRAYNTSKLTPIKNLAQNYEGGTPHIYVGNRSFTSKAGGDSKSGISLIITPSVQETQEDQNETNQSFQHEGFTPSSVNDNYRSASPFLQVEDTKGVYDQHTTEVTESTFRRTFRGTSRSRGGERDKINSESLVRNMYKVRPEIAEAGNKGNKESKMPSTNENAKSKKVIQQVLKSRRNSGDYTSLLDRRSVGFAQARRTGMEALFERSPGPIYDLSSYKGVTKADKGFLTEYDLLRMARLETEVKPSNRSFVTTGRDSEMASRRSGQPMIIQPSDRRKPKNNVAKGAHFGTAKREDVFSPKIDVPGPGEYNMPLIKSNMGGVQFNKEKKGIGI